MGSPPSAEIGRLWIRNQLSYSWWIGKGTCQRITFHLECLDAGRRGGGEGKEDAGLSIHLEYASHRIQVGRGPGCLWCHSGDRKGTERVPPLAGVRWMNSSAGYATHTLMNDHTWLLRRTGHLENLLLYLRQLPTGYSLHVVCSTSLRQTVSAVQEWNGLNPWRAGMANKML